MEVEVKVGSCELLIWGDFKDFRLDLDLAT